MDGDARKPALVLAGSLGSELAMWEPQLREFGERFTVLRYDHPGHGESALPDVASVEAFARRVLELLDALGLGRFSFCGLSLGGMVGMTLAVLAPGRIDRLVLCATSPKLGTPESWSERAAAVRSSGMQAVADTVLGRWFTPPFAAKEPATVDRFRRMLLSTPPEGYARCCEAVGAFDFRARLGEIEASTLVVSGAADPAVPAEDAELLRSSIRGAASAVLPRAAHLANVERAAEFNASVLEHLAAGSRAA